MAAHVSIGHTQIRLNPSVESEVLVRAYLGILYRGDGRDEL